MDKFTWIPLYKEFGKKLMKFRNDRQPLIDWIYDNLQGFIPHLKDDTNGTRVHDIDPLTVFAIFNRGLSLEKRIDICFRFKEFLGIEADVPADFESIPVMNAMKSNFMAFAEHQKDGDIERLWNVFEAAVMDTDIEEPFNALRGQYLIKFNLTMALFWIRPDKFLALDGQNRDYLKKYGIKILPYELPLYKDYAQILEVVKQKMESGEIPAKSFPELSFNAWEESRNNEVKEVKEEEAEYTNKHVWVIALGSQASMWERCKENNEICIGWEETGNLSKYNTKEDYKNLLRGTYNKPNENFMNTVLCLYDFVHVMKPGDIVVVRSGVFKIIGRGIVESEYIYNEEYDCFNSIRKVRWTHIGEWEAPWRFTNKTMTEISRMKEACKQVEDLFKDNNSKQPKTQATNNSTTGERYWWLVANPQIWSFANLSVGQTIEYELYNDRGNKRRIFQNFVDAREGDVVICYEATPTKKIVGFAEISRASDGKTIECKKTQELLNPIDLDTFKDMPELAEMEYIKNSQGSFFKLTKNEYDVLMDIILEENPAQKELTLTPYTEKDFLNEVYITKDDFNTLKHLLTTKKNIILQGAPGVGKTFSAKRLCYAMMGEVDESRIEFVQFHQNYSYEDFIMGYKPTEDGGFTLKRGLFYNFCKRAKNDPDSSKKYFFIIDEINRGNMSKIFGELMMLIEKDYRGDQHAIKLAYSDELFSVPENVYIIGMMNTADRSLAMIDYALRRRFSFFDMRPGFDSEGFAKYMNSLNSPEFNRVIEAIKQLNGVIERDDSLGSGFCIGHSYFCNQAVISSTWLKNVIEYDIIPMLREYWFDDNTSFENESKKLKLALA